MVREEVQFPWFGLLKIRGLRSDLTPIAYARYQRLGLGKAFFFGER